MQCIEFYEINKVIRWR